MTPRQHSATLDPLRVYPKLFNHISQQLRKQNATLPLQRTKKSVVRSFRGKLANQLLSDLFVFETVPKLSSRVSAVDTPPKISQFACSTFVYFSSSIVLRNFALGSFLRISRRRFFPSSYPFGISYLGNKAWMYGCVCWEVFEMIWNAQSASSSLQSWTEDAITASGWRISTVRKGCLGSNRVKSIDPLASEARLG